MTEPWVLRRFVADDEGCVVSMWIRSLWRWLNPRWRRDSSLREPTAEFWSRYQPIITALVRGSDVVVACDPDRQAYEPGLPSVLWGWACTSGDLLVLGVGIKHGIQGAGYGGDLARDLLGDRLGRPQETVTRLPDLEALNLVPETWARRVGWLDELLSLSDRIGRADALWNGVAAYVADPQRKPWVPSGKRAAA